MTVEKQIIMYTLGQAEWLFGQRNEGYSASEGVRSIDWRYIPEDLQYLKPILLKRSKEEYKRKHKHS